MTCYGESESRKEGIEFQNVLERELRSFIGAKIENPDQLFPQWYKETTGKDWDPSKEAWPPERRKFLRGFDIKLSPKSGGPLKLEVKDKDRMDYDHILINNRDMDEFLQSSEADFALFRINSYKTTEEFIVVPMETLRTSILRDPYLIHQHFSEAQRSEGIFCMDLTPLENLPGSVCIPPSPLIKLLTFIKSLRPKWN